MTKPASAPSLAPTVSNRPERQVWVDQLRTFMIFLVVNMHACCTYSYVGGWYVRSGPEPSLAAKIPFFFWQGHLQAFFMGLLFFLAGHFAHRSLERKRPGAFMYERFVRLMIPSLLYMLVIHPFIVAGLNPYNIPSASIGSWLWRYYSRFEFVGQSGPLWFAVALFVFCAVLVLWRSLRPVAVTPAKGVRPSGAAIALLGVGLVLSTFLVRTVQPIGSNILNFQLCFFPQYIAVFAAGVISARENWLKALARSGFAARLGMVGLIGGPLVLLGSLMLFPPTGNPPALFGGWNFAALSMAFWEQLTGLALGIGCLALFARYFNKESPTTSWLSDNSFGVYVLHAPILVALTAAFASLQGGPWFKMLLLTVVGLVASYALSAAVRAVPGVKRIL